jgi:hypothetical protein
VLRGRLFISALWASLKNAVDPEYAPLNTGVNITRANSANGALPIRESAHGEAQDNAGQ